MRARVVAVLSAGVLLTTLGWTGETWAQAKIARVGILTLFAIFPNDPTLTEWLEPFRGALAGQGWIEGKNVTFEIRSANYDASKLGEAAADLVRLNVDVILAVGAPCVRAVHTATRTVPVIAIDYSTDPVTEGYVQSYGRPGGNLTGVFLDAPEFSGKWLQLLKAIIPGLSRIAVLWDPSPGAAHLRAVQTIAQSFRMRIQILEVNTPDDLDRAFSRFRGEPQALIILPSPMMYMESKRLAQLSMKHRVPATSMARPFAEAGGMVAYGPLETSTFERAAVLVGKILAGAKPGDLPIERPTKVRLVVNLKSAKALGLTVPESVLYRADEVIR